MANLLDDILNDQDDSLNNLLKDNIYEAEIKDPVSRAVFIAKTEFQPNLVSKRQKSILQSTPTVSITISSSVDEESQSTERNDDYDRCDFWSHHKEKRPRYEFCNNSDKRWLEKTKLRISNETDRNLFKAKMTKLKKQKLENSFWVNMRDNILRYHMNGGTSIHIFDRLPIQMKNSSLYKIHKSPHVLLNELTMISQTPTEELAKSNNFFDVIRSVDLFELIKLVENLKHPILSV